MSANAIERAKPADVSTHQSEASAVIAMIERAALNPEVDVAKMEQLFALQERVLMRNAKMAYSAALAEMQPQLPVVGERGKIKNKAGDVQSRYALWEDINDAIKPLLAAHGFALSFRTGEADGRIMVTGILSHREGHSEETTIGLPRDDSGNKNQVQMVGSSVSYGKRYTASALLNLTSRNEDDDAQAAGNGAINESQVNVFNGLIESTGADLAKLLKYVGADSVEAMNVKQLNDATEALTNWADAQKKKAAKK